MHSLQAVDQHSHNLFVWLFVLLFRVPLSVYSLHTTRYYISGPRIRLDDCSSDAAFLRLPSPRGVQPPELEH